MRQILLISWKEKTLFWCIPKHSCNGKILFFSISPYDIPILSFTGWTEFPDHLQSMTTLNLWNTWIYLTELSDSRWKTYNVYIQHSMIAIVTKFDKKGTIFIFCDKWYSSSRIVAVSTPVNIFIDLKKKFFVFQMTISVIFNFFFN